MELRRSWLGTQVCRWQLGQNERRGTREDKSVERREKRDGHMRKPGVSVMGGERAQGRESVDFGTELGKSFQRSQVSRRRERLTGPHLQRSHEG